MTEFGVMTKEQSVSKAYRTTLAENGRSMHPELIQDRRRRSDEQRSELVFAETLLQGNEVLGAEGGGEDRERGILSAQVLVDDLRLDEEVERRRILPDDGKRNLTRSREGRGLNVENTTHVQLHLNKEKETV